jgi:hypothetical protein
MATEYRFLPWTRRGLARAISTPFAPAASARPVVSVNVQIPAQQDGADAGAVQAPKALRLFGPADVIGFDSRLVLRTDPKPDTSNFEPNYLALIDFDPPELPWLFTPAAANAQQRLQPWLVLLVLDRAKVAPPSRKADAPLPSVTVRQADAPGELPNLTDAWMWAHAQATSEANNAAALDAELAQAPASNCSRLLSPRRLSPGTAYLACLVPAFKVGVDAGLGRLRGAVDSNALTLAPAWQAPFTGDVELPVYFHWSFSTGPAGDFETLARRIKTPAVLKQESQSANPEIAAQAAQVLASLSGLGTAPMSVDADRLLSDNATPLLRTYEGAMVALSYQSAAPASDGVANKLQSIVNAPQTQFGGGGSAERAPTVAPPLYGAWHARQHVVNATAGRWLNELNRDPRFRAAAAQSTRVIQKYQEELMDACWEQVGDILRTERALHRAALAKAVQTVLHQRLSQLPDERLLSVFGPMAARVRIAPQLTVFARVQQTSIPNAISDVAWRRLTSAQRPLLKAAVRRSLDAAPVATQMASLHRALARAASHPHVIDPNRVLPDGILGSASYGRLELPADDAAEVSLEPIGLAGSLRAGELRTLQQGQAKAQAWYERKRADGAAAWRPKLKAELTQGLLSDAHMARLTQVALAAPQPVPLWNLVRAVQTTPGLRQSEGALVALRLDAAQVGLLTEVQPLKIDARDGTIQRLAALRAPVGPGPATPRSRLSPASKAAAKTANRVQARTGLSLGTIPIRREIGEFGNGAIFGTLPVNTLPARDGAAVAIGSATGAGLAGLFSGLNPPALDGVVTVTLPAPLRDRLTLQRFGQALREYNQLWLPPLAEGGLKVQALDFPLNTATNSLKSRSDPAFTVPARLASSLRLGAGALALDSTRRSLVHPQIAHALPMGNNFADVRFVVPRLWDRVMAYPKLVFPLAGLLAEMDSEAMVPGARGIPNDLLMLARTNNRFVESFLVGANHEMGRELLWRGFPTDQRGSPLRHFWPRLDGQPDVEELHRWLANRPLGQQPPQPGQTPGDKLVLVIRATLVRRFPNLMIYARRKSPNGDRLAEPGEFNPALPADEFIKRPMFAGPLPPDLVYVGFDIPAAGDLSPWCFVLEEPMTEPRFGFDEPDSGRKRPDGPLGWKDVLWSQVLPPGEQFLRPAHLANLIPGQPRPVSLSINAHAADAAAALLQRPFRAYYLAESLDT